MDRETLQLLQKITPEEQAILAGSKTIDRELYMQGQSNTVNAGKLLAAGKLITVRPTPGLSTSRSIPTTM